MANSTSSLTVRPVHDLEQPVQDEWGIFDPHQAGLAALLRKLQSISGDKDGVYTPPKPVTK